MTSPWPHDCLTIVRKLSWYFPDFCPNRSNMLREHVLKTFDQDNTIHADFKRTAFPTHGWKVPRARSFRWLQASWRHFWACRSEEKMVWAKHTFYIILQAHQQDPSSIQSIALVRSVECRDILRNGLRIQILHPKASHLKEACFMSGFCL